MKILIVGAGIGGLTLAAFCEKVGIHFDIIDECKDWSNQGFSLGMWDNGRDILKKLGLSEEFDRQGERIRSYVLKNGEGKVLKYYDLDQFYIDYGSAYTHIDRSTLHSLLRSKISDNKVQLSTTVLSLHQNKEKISVTFSDNSTKEYDVVVGADGVHSQIRQLVFSEKDHEKYIEWRAWYIWVDNSFKKEQTVTEYIEPNEFIAVFDDKDKTLAVLLAPAQHTEWDEEKNRTKRLERLFKHHTTLVPSMLSSINPKTIIPTDIAVVTMKKWVAGRVVLLGDAAHAMEPFGGLGGSMAMEDAYVLAGELFKTSKGKTSLEDAFLKYQKERMKRVKVAHKATRNMRWWALTRSKTYGKLIQTIAPFVPKILFTRYFHKLLRQEI